MPALLLAWLRVLLILALACLAIPAAAQPAGGYLGQGELLQRALSALFAKIGTKPRIAMIMVEPAFVTVLTQSVTRPKQMDEWTISRFAYLWFDRDSVNGPAPHQSEGATSEADKALFDIDTIDFDALEDITARAKEYAGFEDPAQVTLLRIAREIVLLPERSYGPVQLQISLSSSRESATVHASASGEILGGDLSGMIRAQRLDMLEQDDWPIGRAAEQLAMAIGDDAIVHQVSVAPKSITVRAENPASRNLLRDYSWDYSGVQRDMTDIPNPLAPDMPTATRAFPIAEAGLASLATIKAAARKAYASSPATLTGMAAVKPAEGPGPQAVRWRVQFAEPGGRYGHVDVGITGAVLDKVTPSDP